ncbi:hypothetical protein QN362_10310 [Actimicrobium sp. CCC2.4]|uniref:hypothetical protein n=1 Tax=Actimicrobium sp. CCC2.4 TaxID=3048606 RepID=UPI002AC9BFB8|nr:hypothetical protein [Actimicrobium sp. CCC2.4]MEB0135720.1 hypothetical protein [Actimicrobium sp. CCC2.4]WPX33723.1 hypothetical protein RHM62_07860 [Actimicrobium sp. CCC2.4]
MASTFVELINGFCRLKQLDNQEELAAGTPFGINGVCCSLIYNKALAVEVVFLYVEYAYAPLDRLATIYKKLLQRNHQDFDGHGPGYCISPTTGKIVELTRLALPGLTPELLAGTLLKHAVRQQRWCAQTLPGN